MRGLRPSARPHRSIVGLALLAAMSFCGAADADTQSIDFLMQAPNLGSFSFSFPVGEETVTVDSQLGYDEKGKIVAAADSTIGADLAVLKGKLKNVGGNWTYTIKYKAMFVRASVKVIGIIGQSTALVTYKGPAGKAKNVEAALDVFPDATPVQATLTLIPEIDCNGKVTGHATISAAYGAGVTRVGSLKGKLKGDVLVMKITAEKSKFIFKGAREGDEFSGTWKVKFPPEKNTFDMSFPFDVSPPVDCGANTRDSEPPVVSITSPANDSTALGTVALVANATDNDRVVGVQFLLDGAPLGTEILREPFTVDWDTTTVADGPYTISATARDPSGNSASAAGVVINVTNVDEEAPTVSIVSPSPSAVVGGTVVIEADADDNVGVTNVRFLIDGTPVGEPQFTAPFQYEWNTFSVDNGSYALSAIAEDSAGNSSSSAEVTVEVDNGERTPPVAAYGFEELGGGFVEDSSGAGNTGAVFGPARSETGRFGRALEFDGLDDALVADHSPSLNPSAALTLEAWVWPRERAGHVVMKGSNLYFLSAGSGEIGPSFGAIRQGAGAPESVWSTTQIPLESWSHIAGTFDGSTLRAYVNGELVDSWPLVGPLNSDDGPLLIGSSGSQYFFDGFIDEVRIYDRALSVEELRYDMDTPVVEGEMPTPLEDLHQQIDDLAAGSWMSIPSSHIHYVAYDDRDDYRGDVAGIMESASGGFFDSTRDRLVVWGGGQQYCGNEIYAFDLGTLQWSRLNDPSDFPADDENNQSHSLTHPDGAPISRHSYDHIYYLPTVDRFFVGSGVAICPSGVLNDVSATYAFDFDTMTWESRAVSPSWGEALGAVGPDGRVWQHGDVVGFNYLSVYDPETDEWTRHAEFPTVLNSRATAEIDPVRNKFVVVGVGTTYVWDLDNPDEAAVVLDSSGDTAIEDAQAPGLAYHPGRDRIVAWHGGRDVYSLDLDSATWSLETEGGGEDPGAPTTRGTYGRWRYVASRDVFIHVSSIYRRVFLYRLP